MNRLQVSIIEHDTNKKQIRTNNVMISNAQIMLCTATGSSRESSSTRGSAWVFSLHESAACVPADAPRGCAPPPSQQTSCCGSRSPRRELCTQGTCDGDHVSSICLGILCGSCAHIASCRSRCQRVRIGKSGIVPPAPAAYLVDSSAEAPPRAEPQVASSGSDAAR